LIWYKLELDCFRNNAILIEEILVAFGAFSISSLDNGNTPIFEPKVGQTPIWEKVKLIALFDKYISTQMIAEVLGTIRLNNLKISELEDVNWIQKYQENFKPIKFGKNLYVFPSWEESLDSNSKIIIKMDPGMAFGSGSHETTALCLEYLDSNPPRNNSVMDFGCGSGILGIASLLLGAKECFAYDIDPQAELATAQNAKRNKVDNRLFILNYDEISNHKVDLLISNILANTLIELKDQFMGLLRQNGKIVLSGIMESQLEKLCQSFDNIVDIKKIYKKNGWCLLEGEKK